jgi:hypothetical protein
MFLLLLLLMSTADVARGLEVVDYLRRDVADVFSNTSIQRGKDNYIDKFVLF